MAKRRKKKRTTKETPVASGDLPPRSFIFTRGRVPRAVRQLVADLRSVMAPHTAANLQVRRSNRLRDFVSVASPLGVTHLLVATASDTGSQLRVMRIPHGPTVTMRVSKYTLMSDIAQLRRRPRSPGGADFKVPPLVVLNNFRGGGREVPLLATMFQNMFPPLNVDKVRIADCRRVVLFNRVPDGGGIEVRHYAVETTASGVSRAIKRIVSSRIPNLERLDDIAQYVMDGGVGYGSESEVEEDPNAQVELANPLDATRGKTSAKAAEELGKGGASKCGIRLHEIGPRMTLEPLKVQSGLDDGDVLFHAHVDKSPEEEQRLREEHARRKEERAKRRKAQEENVRRKKGDDAGKGKGKKKGRGGDSSGEESSRGGRGKQGGNDDDDNEDDDDAEWYRREVGEEPGDDFMATATVDMGKGKKRERFNPLYSKKKKAKKEGE